MTALLAPLPHVKGDLKSPLTFFYEVYVYVRALPHPEATMLKDWYASSFTTVLAVPAERVVAAVLGNDLTGGPGPMIESITYPTQFGGLTCSALHGTGKSLDGSSDSSLDLDQEGTGSDPL